MDTLIAFVTGMLALSMAVERVVEVIKGLVPFLREDPKTDDPRGGRAASRRLILQALSAVIGAGAAIVIGPSHFLKVLPETNENVGRIAAGVLIGLMGSGGSAFWNHALDLLGAFKKMKEDLAKARAPVSKQVGTKAESGTVTSPTI